MSKNKSDEMTSFSQRIGITPVKSVIQVDSMDNDLRNCLWSALYAHYFESLLSEKYIRDLEEMNAVTGRLWHRYFKYPIDTRPHYCSDLYKKVRTYFFKFEWNEVYDFIEFVANNYPDDEVNQKFMNLCNSILEREISAYRFVGDKITQITSKVEIAEIEAALEVSKGLKTVNTHLKTALDMLADRKSPDYRNSIKESISAVESICKIITKNDKVKLGQALKEIESKVGLHGALKKAFNSLYGYTSDAEGIRHALLDEPNLDFEDAKFMLVSCSAFVNYLVVKASKAGIKI